MLDKTLNFPDAYICENTCQKEGNPGFNLKENELKLLFEFATKETHFLFKGTCYDQVDGEAMPPPPSLGPILTYLFMGHHENKWLEQEFRSFILSPLPG